MAIDQIILSEYIPYREIAGHLDLHPGDILLVASDITRLALRASRNEGSFDAGLFIESLQAQLTKKGTLLIPSYNFHLKDKSSFDILHTRPITGALSLAAFGRKDFHRTKNPLHSFLVWGHDAESLCQIDNPSSFSAESPFAYLYDRMAKMLLIDTSVKDSFTFTHFVEEIEQVDYREYKKFQINYTDLDGGSTLKEYYLFSKKAGWTMDLGGIEKMFEDTIMRKVIINGISFALIPLDQAFPLIRDDIRNNKAGNIAYFSMKIYFKDILKSLLLSLRLYKTVSDRIADDPGL